MDNKEIININKTYWNENAGKNRGTISLPSYGINLATEDELHLFGDVSGKKMLEIGCGDGHSLKYHALKGAGELWGLDISNKQISCARALLKENGYMAKFICAPMEEASGIPVDYFDYVYSIYGIGWTTNVQGTFNKIASYLQKGGIFIFSWHHTLNYCVSWSDKHQELFFNKSYFDEGYFTKQVNGSKVILCSRKISTYINALAVAGFAIEYMAEQPGNITINPSKNKNGKIKKAEMLPVSMCFKARKL